MFRRKRTRIRALLVASILLGLGGLTGCGTTSVATNTAQSASNTQRGYQAFQSDKYTSAPSLTKQWMKTNETTHSVTVNLSVLPNGLSLNGYYHGFAEIEVPVGWAVTLSFHNKNPDMVGKLAVVSPKDIFRASVPSAIEGTVVNDTPAGNSSAGGMTMQFTPKKAGVYVVESVPTVVSGTWLWFVVNSKATNPEVKLRK